MVRSSRPETTGIYLGSLATRERTVLSRVQSRAEIARDPAGGAYLVFANGPSLMGQPFDAEHGRLTGEPFPIADSVVHGQYIEPLHATFATSDEGVLAYMSQRPLDQLTWFERDGARGAALGAPGVHLGASLAADERTVAFTLQDSGSGKFAIWRRGFRRWEAVAAHVRQVQS